MDRETFEKLGRGDVVRHKSIDHATSYTTSYIVVANYGNRVTAIDLMSMTNPDEWDLTYKATRVNRPTAFCKNCQDPWPGKAVHVTTEQTKHRGTVMHCAYCGREVPSGE